MAGCAAPPRQTPPGPPEAGGRAGERLGSSPSAPGAARRREPWAGAGAWAGWGPGAAGGAQQRPPPGLRSAAMLAAAAAGLEEEEEETQEEKEEAEVGTAAGARPEAGLQPGMLPLPLSSARAARPARKLAPKAGPRAAPQARLQLPGESRLGSVPRAPDGSDPARRLPRPPCTPVRLTGAPQPPSAPP